MLSQNQIKHISALKLKKFREEYREFVAEGNTLVLDLISSAYEISGIYAVPDWIKANIDLIRQKNIPVFEADSRDMERISSLSTPSPVLAVVKIPPDKTFPTDCLEQSTSPASPETDPGNLILMLEGISDPGNFGTMLRIADWFGIGNIICSENCVELYNPKVVQASMGSIVRVKVTYTDLGSFLSKLGSGFPVYGTFPDGESLYSSELEKNGIILIGSEARGISPALSHFISRRLAIPSFGSTRNGKAESLNAAVAAGIVIAEFRRRTG